MHVTCNYACNYDDESCDTAITGTFKELVLLPQTPFSSKKILFWYRVNPLDQTQSSISPVSIRITQNAQCWPIIIQTVRKVWRGSFSFQMDSLEELILKTSLLTHTYYSESKQQAQRWCHMFSEPVYEPWSYLLCIFHILLLADVISLTFPHMSTPSILEWI